MNLLEQFFNIEKTVKDLASTKELFIGTWIDESSLWNLIFNEGLSLYIKDIANDIYIPSIWRIHDEWLLEITLIRSVDSPKSWYFIFEINETTLKLISTSKFDPRHPKYKAEHIIFHKTINMDSN